jgi:beta-glucanase (GH16 family)
MSRRPLALLVACLSAVLALLLGSGAGAPSFAAPKPKPVAQSVAVRVLPQVAAAGTTPEPASTAQAIVTAAFSPVVPGRSAHLEVLDGRKWVPLAIAAQDGAGRAQFTVPALWRGLAASYRVAARSSTSLPAVTSATVRTDAWGTPILSDEFSGTLLAAPWDHRVQGYDVPSRRCSRTDASATRVAGGVLELSVVDDPGRDEPCAFTNNQGQAQTTFYRLNGHVGTQGRFQYRYGVAAARIRFQEARGQHGAFWMQAPVVESGNEIDVIEWFGAGSSGLSSGVWSYAGGTQTKVAEARIGDGAAYGSDWTGSYHVFSVEWTPTEYVFRIDGRETLRTSAGVSQTEEYLILSLLVSNFESLRITPEELPQTMSVDWVRVWQQ